MKYINTPEELHWMYRNNVYDALDVKDVVFENIPPEPDIPEFFTIEYDNRKVEIMISVEYGEYPVRFSAVERRDEQEYLRAGFVTGTSGVHTLVLWVTGKEPRLRKFSLIFPEEEVQL